MNLTIERAELLKSLGHVQSLVERRNTTPILSNVRLEAGENGLSLDATDRDMEVVETTACQVGQPGVTTAPAHTLYDIVRKLPEGAQVEMTFDGDKQQLVLRSGRSRFALACLSAEAFPALSDGTLPHAFSIAAADLRSMIDRTRFAVSTEETRYYLNGIFMHAAVSGGVDVLRAAATDGHRLARVEVPLPPNAQTIPGVIIPRKTVGELRKLLDEGADEVQVTLSDTKIRFAFGRVVLTSKLIDGTFPDYERVIPSENDKIMEVDCKAFAKAVDRVSAISSEKSRAIKVAIVPGVATLSASSTDQGTATEELEVSYDGPPLEIGFNARYLMDIMGEIVGDSVRFVMADSSSPTVVREVADASAVYVLMPMRV